jgi:hypothetical protein
MSGERRPIDDRQFDLLVDGQLSPAERRELLARCDGEPGAWRRCALAFLEAQAWREDLGAMVRPASAPANAPAPMPTVGRRRAASRWPALLAVAASFLMAFTLGLLVRPAWRAAAPRVDQVARQSAEAVHPDTEGLRGSLDDAASPWRMVTLTGPDASAAPIQLPAMERNRLDNAWLGSLPAAVPPDVLRALERTGHSVRQSRQLMPVPLEDGRRLVVPVDQVEVQPAARYQ